MSVEEVVFNIRIGQADARTMGGKPIGALVIVGGVVYGVATVGKDPKTTLTILKYGTALLLIK